MKHDWSCRTKCDGSFHFVPSLFLFPPFFFTKWKWQPREAAKCSIITLPVLMALTYGTAWTAVAKDAQVFRLTTKADTTAMQNVHYPPWSMHCWYVRSERYVCNSENVHIVQSLGPTMFLLYLRYVRYGTSTSSTAMRYGHDLQYTTSTVLVLLCKPFCIRKKTCFISLKFYAYCAYVSIHTCKTSKLCRFNVCWTFRKVKNYAWNFHLICSC